MVRMLQQAEGETVPSQSLKKRAAAFSAMAALPADTDSFLAVSRLGQLVGLVGESVMFPGADLLTELDSLALGMEKKTVEDMQRLMPLIQVLSDTNQELGESWGARANADAARAIVAQQREDAQAAGEQLVAATRDFHLSPIYMTLSCRPGGERLLQQLSVLPLMLPVDPDGPYEMTVRNGWKGFCLRGDKVPVESADLAPEHEDALKQNMQTVRLYLLARVFGNKLVLVLCSDLEEVRLPARVENSVLNTEQMALFDSCLQHEPWVVGYSSPEVVNLRESMNLQSYRSVAAFMRGIFRNLAPQGEQFQAAADAVDSLLGQLDALMPARKHAEQLAVWKSDAVYIRMVTDAGGQRFEPGQITCLPLSRAGDTIFYAESTPVAGTPSVDLPGMLDCVGKIQTAYLGTLAPGAAEHEKSELEQFMEMRPGMDKLVSGIQKVASTLTGQFVLCARETRLPAEPPAHVTLRAAVNDAGVFQDGFGQLREGMVQLSPESESVFKSLQLESGEGVILCHNGNNSMPPAPAAVQVPGGAVFSLNVAAAARALEQAAEEETATQLKEAASLVERVDGCLKIENDQLYSTLRLQVTK